MPALSILFWTPGQGPLETARDHASAHALSVDRDDRTGRDVADPGLLLGVAAGDHVLVVDPPAGLEVERPLDALERGPRIGGQCDGCAVGREFGAHRPLDGEVAYRRPGPVEDCS